MEEVIKYFYLHLKALFYKEINSKIQIISKEKAHLTNSNHNSMPSETAITSH
jgi:hypothetical protein